MSRTELLATLVGAVCFCILVFCLGGCTEVGMKLKNDCIKNAPNAAFCRGVGA